MSNNKTALKVLIGIAVIGGSIWYFTKPKTKAQMVAYLVKNKYHSNENTLSTFDDAYIKAWYDAAKAKIDKFIYNGTNYWVQGGTVAYIR
jgi:hypothetical protein